LVEKLGVERNFDVIFVVIFSVFFFQSLNKSSIVCMIKEKNILNVKRVYNSKFDSLINVDDEDISSEMKKKFRFWLKYYFLFDLKTERENENFLFHSAVVCRLFNSRKITLSRIISQFSSFFFFQFFFFFCGEAEKMRHKKKETLYEIILKPSVSVHFHRL
jgi:hypothetical protein